MSFPFEDFNVWLVGQVFLIHFLVCVFLTGVYHQTFSKLSLPRGRCDVLARACLYLGGIPHQQTKISQQNRSAMSRMLANHSTVMLNVVNVIQEGVLWVIHRMWIRLEVIRNGLQVKLRITGLRILRLRVRVRARKAK